MRRIEVTYSTMGQGGPYPVGGHKDYVWNGDPDKSEAARTGVAKRPQEALRGSPAIRAQERIERYKKFCQLRDQGMDVVPAGREVGVERRAANRYERQRKDEAGIEAVKRAGYAAWDARQREEAGLESPAEIVARLHAKIAAQSPEHAALVAAFEAKQRTGGVRC